MASKFTRGDIVRHSDYPQWGPGYVIRAPKKTIDIFFHWGGRRRIPAHEQLEPSRVAGIESDLFSMCAEHSPQSWSRGHYTLYAIELDSAVAGRSAFKEKNPGGSASGCLYIGMTGLTPEKRFERHKSGRQSSKYVRAHGRRLRLDLVEGYSRLPYQIAAFMEPKVAAWLRAQGFGVWQN